MSDFLIALSRRAVTRRLIRSLGLPTPVILEREEAPYSPEPLSCRRVVVHGSMETPVSRALDAALKATGAERIAESSASVVPHALVFDATTLDGPAQSSSLYAFFHDWLPRLPNNARVLVISPAPEQAADALAASIARGAEGFVRSLAKELGKSGSVANLLIVEFGAEDRLAGPVSFLLSPRAAFVSGQAIRISRAAPMAATLPCTSLLKDKIALVTGAAQGLGAATAQRLTEEGAHVLALDVGDSADTLAATAARIGAVPLTLDVTAPDAPAQLAAVIRKQFGGIDIIVHNAGVIRDKTLAKMDPRFWQRVVAVNLDAIVRIDHALIDAGLLRDRGRVICLSSIAGIAGNVGQTNYAFTKAAVIGYVAAQARLLAARGITFNAVAPGLVETTMMMTMPFVFREVARRLNSLSQAGIPRDVAEVITFLATPGAAGINGQVIRVCGQNLIGA